MQDNAACLITLSRECDISMLQRRELFLVALPFTLQLLSNLLLEHKGLQSVVTLLLSASQTNRETCRIILLLINESPKTTIFTLVILNLDLEVLSFLGKLLREDLEFEKLWCRLAPSHD
jgi:hypothetical protein